MSAPTPSRASPRERVEEMLRPEKPREVFRWVLTVVVLALFVWGLTVEMKWSRLLNAPSEMATYTRLMFQDPEWSVLPHLFGSMWESISMAWLGTLIATVFSIPLSFLAAENLVGRPVAWVTRQVFNALRAIPEVILAVALIPVFGLRPTTGVMAIAIGSIGTLGKLCYEVVEGLDRGPIEASEAVGSNAVQRLRWGVVPQVLPELTSFAMYRFEVNIRASAVMGMVGAGGIGTDLVQYIDFGFWERAGLALIVVIGATILVDSISGRIRRRIVAGPDGTIEGPMVVMADTGALDGGGAAFVIRPDDDRQDTDDHP